MGEYQNVDIELGIPEEHRKLQPFLKWSEWKMFNKKPRSPLQNFAGAFGLFAGGIAAADNFNITELFVELATKNVHLPPVGLNVLKKIFASGTIVPRVALCAVNLQNEFADLANAYEHKDHLPTKDNQRFLKWISNTLQFYGNSCLAVMGVFIEINFLIAPRPFKLFLVPFVFVSNYYITAVNLKAEVNLAYAYFNPGKKPDIVQKRAELVKQVELILKAISSMTNEEFSEFFNQMTNDETPTADKLKQLFQRGKIIPTPDYEEKWQEKFAGIIGIVGAAVSTYAGTVPLSFDIADWIAIKTHNDDSQTNTFLSYLISIGSYIPYYILCAKAAHYQFKNLVTPWVHEHLPGSPVITAHPTLRKVANRLAPIFAFLAALPNAFWPFALIKPPEKADPLGIITLLIDTALYTAFTKELFKGFINFYESYSSDSQAVLHEKLIADVQFLTTAIGQLPDDDVEALHQYVKDPIVTDLITRQFAEQKNKRGFFSKKAPLLNENINQPEDETPSYFQRISEKIWPRRIT